MLLKSREKPIIFSQILLHLDYIRDKRQEHYVVLTHDSAMNVINKHLVFLGTVSSTISHPREIFAVAIADSASYIIISHNHPSGDVTPSDDDIKATQQFVAAGIIIGIPLKDHVIMAKEEHFSFASNGMLH